MSNLNLNKFGGWHEQTFPAKGFFYLLMEERSWFITPEGHPFLLFGVNHIDPPLYFRPYNADHWKSILHVRDEKDPAFINNFCREIEPKLAAFGFNSLGIHNNKCDELRSINIPYLQAIEFVSINHSVYHGKEDFLDVFSPDFVTHCRKIAAAKAAPLKDDPYLIGYGFTDCPILTDLDARERDVCSYGDARPACATWPRTLRNLPAEKEGKKEFVKLMRKRYRENISSFNSVYQTCFNSFEELLHASDWKPCTDPENAEEAQDNNAFLDLIVDRYYRVAIEAIREKDPNHLIFGDKLNGNTGVPDFLLRTIGKYVDALSVQEYNLWEDQKEHLRTWPEISGRPLFIGDSCFSVPDNKMSNPLGPHFKTQEERAAAFADFARNAFKLKSFLGWHWCGWMDSWEISQPRRQHSGLQDPFGNIYKPMQEKMMAFSKEVYQIAAGS